MFDDVITIGFEQNLHAARFTFHALRTVTQTVAFIGMAGFYFAISGYFETLFGTRMGFDFGHFFLHENEC